MSAAARRPARRPNVVRAHELACQNTIVQAAIACGWHVHAERAARTASGRHATPIQGHAGFPDLVMITPDRTELWVVELKRAPNKIEPAQQVWLDLFAGLGVPVRAAVWWVPEGLPVALDFVRQHGRRGVR